MVKLKAPLMSLNARGRLSKLFSLAKRQSRHIIERKPVPTDAKSPAQLFNRNMFSMCKDLWHLLSEAEKAEWERLATPRHMTGYAWYISQCLRPNPGIYLPLIGGIMQGNIDMDSNRILDLPDPTTPQEPDTRAARSAALLAAIAAHAGLPATHHTRYTDAEVDAILAIHAALVTGIHGAGDSVLATTLNIATHTAIADAHHAKYTTAEAVAAAKTVKLDDFATPNDNTDLNASAARHGLFKKLDGVVTHFLNGLGNWVAVVAGAPTTSGSYVGNNTANRAIPHGLGAIPKYIIVNAGNYGGFGRIITGNAIFLYLTPALWSTLAVTNPNATNFYVGNAASYPKTGNAVGTTYYWVAIG